MRRDGVQSNGGVLYMKTTGVTFNSGWLNLATASGASALLPAGTIAGFGGATAPSGWLVCDGSAISRSVYSLLFDAIGTLYGTGDGSTTFNVPDLRGRIPAGYAPTGGHSDVATLGNYDGAALASRRPRHKHSFGNPSISINDPGHNHSVDRLVHDGNDILRQGGTISDTGGSTGTDTTGITASASGGTVGPQTGAEPTDAPAYLVVNYIIKT
jgi:microcystin-dependent protein